MKDVESMDARPFKMKISRLLADGTRQLIEVEGVVSNKKETRDLLLALEDKANEDGTIRVHIFTI